MAQYKSKIECDDRNRWKISATYECLWLAYINI